MKRKDDARALFNHEASTVLGRVSAGTCTLEVDKRGLKYSIPYDDKDPDHQRVASKITRGDITGSSFAFRATKTEWSMEPGKGKKMPMDQPGREVRTVMSCEVHDVGPVTYPAYKSTTAATRAETEEAKQERDAWQEAIQQERTAAQAAIDSELSQLQARLQLINATIGD
jgi:HK97 family phage prohead protease